MRYTVIIEEGENNYSAYAPDLPGLGVAAETLEEVTQLISEGVQIYIEELQALGQPFPKATTQAHSVELAIA